MRCKTCGHRMITTEQEVEGVITGKVLTVLMHHCTYCKSLDFSPIPKSDKEIVVFT